ncbi:DUF2752 domain-containing protein [Aestuariimicrobium ganziense]|uniref:DUF2752 domain-containing protein n=1 Tax=Aestuariimicrobium ganziense TaxID=2773677 RepID=UPI002E280814|nr:DUF2752 domain-containing protein [Aestuariimicrobium ganziense]
MITLESSFDPRQALASLAGLAGVGAAMAVVNVATGWGVPCPFRAMTGLWCPLCGSTRMGASLVRGDLAAAWAWNPVVLVGFVVMAVCAVFWVVEALGGPAWRPLRPWGGFSQRRLYWVIGVVGVVWTVARNLV